MQSRKQKVIYLVNVSHVKQRNMFTVARVLCDALTLHGKASSDIAVITTDSAHNMQGMHQEHVLHLPGTCICSEHAPGVSIRHNLRTLFT